MAAASIVIDLLMNTGSFETDTKRAQKALDSLSKQAADFGRLVGVGFAAAGAAVTAMVKTSINAADEMNKAAQKAGITAEALSGLKYAADLADVSFENLETGIKKLNTNIFEASQGSKEQADAFKQLGINVDDASGNLKSADQVLLEVAERFQKMEDGANKSALAVKLFGKNGSDLIPLLNAGADGIGQLTDEAKQLGIVIDTETAQAAEQFNDNLSKLEKSASGLSMSLAKNLLPELTEVSNAVAQAAKDAGLLEAAWVALGGAAAIALGKTQFQVNNQRIAEIDKQLAVAKKQLEAGSLNPAGASDRFFNFLVPDVKLNSKARSTLQSRIDSLVKERDSIIASMQSPTATPKTFSINTDVNDKALKKLKEHIPDISAASEAIAKLIESSIELNQLDTSPAQKLQEELDAYTNLDPAVRAYVQSQIDASKANDQAIAQADLLNDAIDREIDSNNKAEEAQKSFSDSIEGYVNSVEKAMDPTIELNDNISKLQSALNLGIIDQEQYDAMVKYLEDTADKSKKTTDAITEFWKEAAHNMQDAMSNFFFDAMQGKLDDLAGSFKATIDRMVANLLASQLSDFLFGSDFGKNGNLGGFIGDVFSGFNLPSFDTGTPFVQNDMVAQIHRGERILTASENRAFTSGNMGGSIYMTINTPDANSFRKSQAQIMADAQRSLNRGRRVV